MLTGNIYPITGESLFSTGEANHEIYREIYGDPIYDIYEDDVIVPDFVFPEDAFENLRAKSGRNRVRAELGFSAEVMEDPICADFGSDLVRAKSGRNQSGAKLGFRAEVLEDLICADFVQKNVCANFGSDMFRAKFGSNQKMEMKIDIRRSPLLKTLLKIRGRIFLGRGELMQRRCKIRGRIFLGRRDLMQRDIWKYSKYLLSLSFN